MKTSVRLFGSWNEAYKVLNRVLASSLSMTQKPWVPQILCTRILTRISVPTLSSCTDSKHAGKTFPSFPRESAIIIAEPLLITEFHLEIVEFLCWSSARFNFEITRQETFFFKSFHTWSSIVLLPLWRFARKAPVAPSSPSQ